MTRESRAATVNELGNKMDTTHTINMGTLKRDNASYRLAAWIDTHDRPQPTVVMSNGKLCVYSVEALADGTWAIVSDVIEPTMQAARDLLGY